MKIENFFFFFRKYFFTFMERLPYHDPNLRTIKEEK